MALFVAYVLQGRLTVFGAHPNLAILPVYFVGLRYGHTKGMLFGALSGALGDSLTGGMLGPAMLGQATVGYLAYYLRHGLFMWTPMLGVVGVAALTIVEGFLVFISETVFMSSPTTLSLAVKFIFIQALLNAVAGVLIRPGDDG